MDDPNDSFPPEHDPEIEALLHFTPVHRRTRRHDGWPPEVQRRFIAALARCGNAGRAADEVGRTMSGAYKVRTAGGGEEFSEAWDKAVDLYLARNPQEARTGRWRPSDGKAAPPPPAPDVPEPDVEAMFDTILENYLLKIDAEREARLAGRVIEADFYVRQLSWIEVVLDLGERGRDVMMELQRGGLHAGEIVATPMSLLLAHLRRLYWEEDGGPERPPLPPLGNHDGEVATGLPLENQCSLSELQNPAARREREERFAVAAEAQRLWEEKARADAAAWAKRVEAEAGEDKEADASDPEEPRS